MARTAAVYVEQNFTKGLITEASALNFPENACTELDNIVINNIGTITRRLGFDFETGYTTKSLGPSITDKAIREYVWENVAGTGNITFVVVQVGNTISFYEVSGDSGLSPEIKSFTVDLVTYQTAGSTDPGMVACSFSSGNGKLFIVNPHIEPIFITYDVSTDAISVEEIDIQIRDFERLEDSLDVEDRPTTLTSLHKYNLYNQGWYADAECASKDDAGIANGNYQVITYWRRFRSDYPSNSDIWWTMKNATEEFDGTYIDRVFFGNTFAPNGHYIVDPFYVDRSSVSGIASLDVVSSGSERPSATTFFAGRVWYAGVNADGYNNTIYFSQIAEYDNQFGKCFQQSDPTSENLSDLLPSDGGVIRIPDAGTILFLFNFQQMLIVVANNGVWGISGSEGVGFTATDYSVRKMSSVSSISASSFIDILGFPVWWGNDGIIAIQGDEKGPSVNILTDQTIKSFYDDIPELSKQYAKGVYNPRTKTVQWAYSEIEPSESVEYYQYNKILCMNVLSGGFYVYTIDPTDSNGPFINGIVSVKGTGVVRDTDNVVDGTGTTVTNSVGAAVTVSIQSNVSLSSSFRYLTTYYDGTVWRLTFSQERDNTYMDWDTYGTAQDFDSYFITGFKVHGQGSKKFQSNYLTCYMDIEEDASAGLQAVWDYASNGNASKWSQIQEVYNNSSNTNTSIRKLKIRGNGRALQFRITSRTGQPFTIIGWSGFETGDQWV